MSQVAALPPSPSAAWQPTSTARADAIAIASTGPPIPASTTRPVTTSAALSTLAPAVLPANGSPASSVVAQAALLATALATLPETASGALLVAAPASLPATVAAAVPATAPAARPATPRAAHPVAAPTALRAFVPAHLVVAARMSPAAEGGRGAAFSSGANQRRPSLDLGTLVGRSVDEAAPASRTTGSASGVRDVPDAGTRVHAPASASDSDIKDAMSTDDAQPSSSSGGSDVEVPPLDLAVFLDYRELVGLCQELLDACPVTPEYFAPHVRYMCKKAGYACFTRRGLRKFAVVAFQR